MSWFFLSFASDDGFLGGAYVEADGDVAAVVRSHALGINPGGQVQMIGPLPVDDLDANVPVEQRERLLSREELGA